MYCCTSFTNITLNVLLLISCCLLKVTVSNPAEVAKTRLQQGKLAKEGGKKVYKHSLDVFAKTWKKEGI